jgi:hypothetical protein
MKWHFRSVPFVAVCVAAAAFLGATWKTVALWNDDAPSHGPLPQAPDDGPAALLNSSPSPAAPAVTASRMTRRQMQTAMAEDQASLDQNQAAIHSLCAKLGIRPEEDIVSLGRYEELAAEGLKFMAVIANLQQSALNPKPDKKQLDEEKLITVMTEWVAKSETIGRLEDDPGKIARLHTAALQASLQLDAPQLQAVQSAISEEFKKLQTDGLTRSHRPEEDYHEWYRARSAALKEAAARIESALPADQRKPYLVEQILHLGTGMKTNTSFDEKTQKGSLSLTYDLPGMAGYRF